MSNDYIVVNNNNIDQLLLDNLKVINNNYVKTTSYENIISYLKNNILTLSNYVALGSGGTCVLVIKNENDLVYKVCLKNRDIVSIDWFKNHVKKLEEANIKIIKPYEYIYENDEYLIYSQLLCKPLSNSYVNPYIVYKILMIFKEMLENKCRLPDIYLNNYGWYLGDLYIYDYHEGTNFYSDNNFYITQFANMFSLLFNKQTYNNLGFGLRIDTLIKDNFGRNYFGEIVVHNLLLNLYNQDYELALIALDMVIFVVSSKIYKSVVNYQELVINEKGILNLLNHTQMKYLAFDKLYSNVNTTNGLSIKDNGCSIGGIGMKIAQMYPQNKVVLANLTQSELITCQDVVNTICLQNVELVCENVVNSKYVVDISLYYALFHHVLKDVSMKNIFELIKKQTRLYCIIELPFGNDALLKIIKSQGNLKYEDTFYYLEDVDKFIGICSNYFDIMDHYKLEYGEGDLNKYVFLLKCL